MTSQLARQIFMTFPARHLVLMVALASIALSGCRSSSGGGSLFSLGSGKKPQTETISNLTAGNFDGCVTGQALDTSRIEIQIEYPTGSSQMIVLRDGAPVYESTDPTKTIFTDVGLIEGHSYHYVCQALVKGKYYYGRKSLDISTMSTHAPDFTGIDAVVAKDSHTVTITWKPVANSGVAADRFKIYGNLKELNSNGSTALNGSGNPKGIDWTQVPVTYVGRGTYTATISGLGDELTYVFGVRACTSENDYGNCDSNTKFLEITMPDSGAPTTNGIQAVEATGDSPAVPAVVLMGGKAVLSAPWKAQNGKITIRKIYVGNPTCAAGDAACNYKTLTCSDNTDSYISIDMPVGNPNKVASTITVDEAAIPATPNSNGIVIPKFSAASPNTVYCFMVQDQDSSHDNANRASAKLVLKDITPPSFSGLTELLNVTGGTVADAETSLKLKFPPIIAETIDEFGDSVGATDGTTASFYDIFYYESDYPLPAGMNACTAAEDLDMVANVVTLTPSEPGERISRTFPSAAGPLNVITLRVADHPKAGDNYVYFTLSNLKTRKMYSACVKARDINKNISGGGTAIALNTLDLTKPEFSGVGQLNFDKSTLMMNVAWSGNADIYKYKVALWTEKAPTQVNSYKLHSENPSGFSFGFNGRDSQGQAVGIPYSDGDVIFAKVEACDDAYAKPNANGPLHYNPNSADGNCTSTGRILSYEVPRISPPIGFSGLTSASPNGAGAVKVTFKKPINTQLDPWKFFSGVMIYNLTYTANPTPGGDDVPNLGSAIFDCACPATNTDGYCKDSDMDGSGTVSCVIPGLDVRRTYYLAGKAYYRDPKGGAPIEISLTNTEAHEARKAVTTTDASAPEFKSGLALDAEAKASGVVLTWNNANDRQYKLERATNAKPPGVGAPAIYYTIYRKEGSNFTDLNNPGTAIKTVSRADTDPSDPAVRLTYTDPLKSAGGAVEEGRTYYYTICAQDETGKVLNTTPASNFACAGSSTPVDVPDVTPPVVSGVIVTDANNLDAKVPAALGYTNPSGSDYKYDELRQWKLQFTATDNQPSNMLLGLRVYRREGLTATPTAATSSDTLIADETTLTKVSTNVYRLPDWEYRDQRATAAGQKGWANYLIVALDASSAHNSTPKSYSVYVNRPAVAQAPKGLTVRTIVMKQTDTATPTSMANNLLTGTYELEGDTPLKVSSVTLTAGSIISTTNVETNYTATTCTPNADCTVSAASGLTIATSLGELFVNGSTYAVTYKPYNTGFGTDTFEYTVQDTKGTTSKSTITVTVKPTNVWIGGGGNSNWSNTANWQAGVVPNNFALAVFLPGACTGTNCNVTINSAANPQGVYIGSGFTGTINQNTNAHLTVGSSGWMQNGGTFQGSTNASTNSSFSGPFKVQGATTVYKAPAGTNTYSYPSSTTYTFAVLDGASFTDQYGSSVFSHNGPISIVPANAQFNHVSVGSNASSVSLNGGTMNIPGNLTLLGTGAAGMKDGTYLVSGRYLYVGTGTNVLGATGAAWIKLMGNSAGQTVQGLSGGNYPNMPNLEIDVGSNPLTITGNIAASNSIIVTSANGPFDASTSTLKTNYYAQNPTINPGNLTWGNVWLYSSMNVNLSLANKTWKVGGAFTVNGSSTSTYINNGTIEVSGDVILTSGYLGDATLSMVGSTGTRLRQDTASSIGLPGTGIFVNKSGGAQVTLDSSLVLNPGKSLLCNSIGLLNLNSFTAPNSGCF